MSETSFNLTQKAFPGITRNIEVDLESLKIRVLYKTLFKRRIFSIDLYEVNENPVQVSKTPVFSFILSLFLSFFTLISIAGCLTAFKVANFNSIMLTPCFAIGAALFWYKYFEEKLEMLVYTSRFESGEYELFSLIADPKNSSGYHHFVSHLGEALKSLHRGRDLRVMIEQTPRKVLLEEFRTSYIEELLKRDVDVVHFLESLQEQFDSKDVTLIPKKYLN